MRYLLDSDWLLDAIGNVPGVRLGLGQLRPYGLAVSIISHGELLDGAFGFSDTPARLSELRIFLDQFETLLLSEPIMEIFGQTRSELRRAGQLIPDLDLLIAATAVHHDLILMTRNVRHFARIPELRLFQAD